VTTPPSVVNPSSAAGQSAATAQPTATSTTLPTTQPTVAAGLNPPHGQPGHRCDIQVGAPLNSTPGAAATSSATPLPPAPVLPSGPPVSTAKGLNPPHGQLGHDCSIPVGAPLKK
jgi:hypothetical protein